MIEKLLSHKTAIDADLKALSKQWRADWAQKYTPPTLTILDGLFDFLNRGGKRVRGALAMESYYLHDGNNQKVALGAARVVELVNAYLLVMDDIQDRSTMRRGGPTVHVQLAAGHSDHYGVAQGLNAEMLLNHRAMSELLNIPVADGDKLRAARLLAEDISVTIVGQINDIYNQSTEDDISEETITATLTWKTAYYTFLQPLELGACLAGREKLDDRLREYALNAGIAFQISDDILGVFGATQVVGKSANDDIREGKATLLTAYARAHANTTQSQLLRAIMGKPSASDDECDKIRQILEETGAREHAEAVAQKYATAAERALGETPESFLVELVRFSIKRTN
jgi:geranylgeranyl diphosphate synthase, type I